MILVSTAMAGELPPEARREEVRPAPDDAKELTFLGLASARATTSNVTTTNPLVNGQLVGTLGGPNSTTTGEEAGAWTEQRVGAFFTYSPSLVGGRASLDAAFEIDFAFGDTSYSVGGNTGGAFGADQVNLQTRRLAVRLNALPGVDVVTGLQFVADGAHDPGGARPDDLVRAGGRLMFWGSEAAGITAYLHREPLRARVGGYTLWELGFSDGDDATLFMADVEYAPAYATRLGLHAWYLRDRSAGQGGLLGVGPTSALSELQGGPRLDFRADADDEAPDAFADLTWVIADVGYNRGLDRGPFGVSAMGGGNLGRLYLTGLEDRAVGGGFGDVEARWRYAQGEGSVLRLEALYVTADDARDDRYTGVVTGNSYGIAGAIQATHGCYLLFPDPGAISRQAALVYDIANGGAGVLAVTGGIAWDPLPDRVTIGVGAGHLLAGGAGTEVNGRVVAEALPLVNVGAHGALLIGTDLPYDAWTAFLSLDWLAL